MEGGERSGRKPELRMRKEGAAPASNERIPGDGGFVERVLRKAEELSRSPQLRREDWTAARVAARAAGRGGVERNLVYGGSKAVASSRARSLGCYWAVKELGMSAGEVARDLGIMRQATGRATGRGEERVRMEGFRLADTRHAAISPTCQRPCGMRSTALVPKDVREQMEEKTIALSALSTMESDDLVEALRQLEVSVHSADGDTVRAFCK